MLPVLHKTTIRASTIARGCPVQCNTKDLSRLSPHSNGSYAVVAKYARSTSRMPVNPIGFNKPSSLPTQLKAVASVIQYRTKLQ